MWRVTAREASSYKKNGYLLYRQPVFNAKRFARLTAIFEEMYAARGDRRGDSLDTPHFNRPELLDFLRDDEILDLVEPLIGPDIGLWSSHFIAKEPFTGRATPWHEDSAYWKGRFDSFHGIVTIWLAIDKVDAINGAMKVIPGTHANGFSAYEAVDPATNTFDTQIKNVDASKAITFELDPNQCSFHDSRIIHGADANTSPRRRCAYTMRYFSQTMKFQADFPSNKGFKIWHCRGKNPHRNPVVN